MKKINWKNLFLVGMITAGLTGTVQTFASDNDGSISGNRFLTRKEYKDMKVSMSKITKDKTRIASLKEQLKADKKGSDAVQTHMTRKALRKAKADLKHDKKYLRIDKRDLMADQWTAIQSANQEKRQAKKELRQAKRQLKKDIRNNDAVAIAKDSKRVEQLCAKKDQEVAASEALKDDVYEFFVYLDDEISEVV